MAQKVSVILPVFNCKQYIAQALENILNQSYKNTLMYQIAKKNGLGNSAQIIKEVLPLTETVGQYFVKEKGLAQKTLDYFLSYKADEYYANDNHAKSIQLLRSINLSSLSEDDLRLFNKLNFRSHFVPIFLK